MNISDAARATGLPAKTIRYYEEIGLVQPTRLENGYRTFAANDVHTLRFLARARGLGFSVEECRELISLYRDKDRASADVRRIAGERVEAIEAKIAELEAMRAMLGHLIARCHGDDRPDCPILDDLAGHAEMNGIAPKRPS